MSPMEGARLLIGLLVVGVVLYCCWLLIGMFGLPHPFSVIVICILGLIALGVVLRYTGFWKG